MTSEATPISIDATSVIQFLVFVVVMGAALISAVWLIRDRTRSAAENMELRKEVARLKAYLEHRDIKPLIVMAAAAEEIARTESLIEEASRQLLTKPVVTRLEKAPAQELVALLRWLFPAKAFDNIFSQIVIDGREEYFEALAQGRTRLARWRLFQMYFTVAITALEWAGVSLVQRAVRLWKIGS